MKTGIDWRASKAEAIKMLDAGFRAGMRLNNGGPVRAADRQTLIYDLNNAADSIRHPECFSEFPAISAKKAAFIQRVARMFAKHPAAPEIALPLP